jgi:hypothetical protein
MFLLCAFGCYVLKRWFYFSTMFVQDEEESNKLEIFNVILTRKQINPSDGRLDVDVYLYISC